MSAYDYVNRSGYGRGLSPHTYVTKVEAYVEEIPRPRATEYTYISPVKVEPSNKGNVYYGRPREVDELLSKILTEVNGSPPSRISDPDRGTGQGRRSFPVMVESRSDPRTDPWHSTYLGEVGPERDSSSGYKYGTAPIRWELMSEYDVPNRQHGTYSGHVYDRLPQKDYGSPRNQWVRSSDPGHSHRPQRDYSVPNNQWANYPVKPETLKNGHSDDQWGSPPMKTQSQEDYGAPSYLSRIKLGRPKDHGAPNNKWSSSPVKPQTVGSYGVSNDYGVPKNKWGSSPTKSWTRQRYGIPSDPSPLRPESPNDNGAPNNRWGSSPNDQWDNQSPTELETPRDYPKKQWSNTFRDYGDPDDQWDRPSSQPEPWKDHGVVPNNQQGSYPRKTQTQARWDGRVPSNQRESSSNPVYDHQPPKATYDPYDEPKGNSNNYPMPKPTGYPDDQHRDYGTDGWQPNPYNLDHKPQDYGSTNGMKPSGYKSTVPPPNQAITPPNKGINNIGEAFGQLTVADGVLPEVAAGRSPVRKQEAMWGPADVDSREEARRYGGIPSRAYTGEKDLKRTISSKEALQKYDGAFVPQ